MIYAIIHNNKLIDKKCNHNIYQSWDSVCSYFIYFEVGYIRKFYAHKHDCKVIDENNWELCPEFLI